MKNKFLLYGNIVVLYIILYDSVILVAVEERKDNNTVVQKVADLILWRVGWIRTNRKGKN